MKALLQKILVTLVLIIILAASTGNGASAAPHGTVDIQILNVSDWHGQLDPLVVGTTQVGGAAALSAYFQADRAANPNTLTLTAGDAVGATPPISSFFNDEPTIFAMNMMGFQADTLGNHNFDAGISGLQNQIDLANFQYVSANLENRDDNLTGVKNFEIFDIGGVKIGVIGITNPEAPELVFPGNFGTITPSEPVNAALNARGAAKDAGADIVIVITHMGVTGFDTNGAPFGPLIDFAKAVNKNSKNPKIDVIIGDHTDIQFSGIINGALVYENRSKGLTYAKANLTVDAANHKILNKSVTFVTPLVSAVTPDAAITNLVESYRLQLAPILNIQVGSSSVFIPRTDSCGNSNGRICESLIGNVTTDAMRDRYGVDFAITNSGGLRANLTCPTTNNPSDFCPAYTPPPYPITRGQVLTVLPFGNSVATVTVTGAELKDLLETSVAAMPGVNGRFAQISGLCFTYNIEQTPKTLAPAVVFGSGNRVTSVVFANPDGSCTSTAIDLSASASYTLAENDFMANGGDGYPNVSTTMVTRELLDQVVADYISTAGTISPTLQGRITCFDPNPSTGNACPVTVP